MKTDIKITEPDKVDDYFPCLFANKDNSVIILADERVNDRCFSGMVIYSKGNTTKTIVGKYNSGWTYTQFKRLKKRSEVELTIIQGEL